MILERQRVVVIGAGVLGSAAAAALANTGFRVTLVSEEPGPTTRVSAASFAWVNAHRKTPPEYAELNADGRAEHLRRGIACGWFVASGATADDVHYATDGYVDTARFIAVHRAALVGAGGAIRTGVHVSALRRRNAEIVVESADAIDLTADIVVLAAGTGTAALARTIGATARRLVTATGPEGYIARLRLDGAPAQILSADGLQLRPDGVGLVAAQSLTIEHDLRARGERATAASVWPALREEICAALGRHVPKSALVRVDAASRPMASDGLPALGWLADGVYALLTHSGVTLAPLLGPLIARDIAGDPDGRLAQYRPDSPIGCTP